MHDYNFSNSNSPAISAVGAQGIEIRPLMRSVYMWMTIALSITGVIAYVLANTMVAEFAVNNYSTLQTISSLMFPILIGQVILAMAMGFFLHRMNPTLAIGLFMVYAITMGITMSAIIFSTVATPEVTRTGELVMKADWSIVAKAFFSAAGLFGAMTVIGYTTKVDLSRFSTFFLMGLVGLIVASVVNIFMRSDTMSFIISIVGVLLFTAITAWDTQRIKEMAAQDIEKGSATYTRLAIWGAFQLYLDFINLFIYLLRIFASSRD